LPSLTPYKIFLSFSFIKNSISFLNGLYTPTQKLAGNKKMMKPMRSFYKKSYGQPLIGKKR